MTAEPVVLRRAKPADAAAIARVHVETWRATYAGLVPDAYLVGMTEAGQTASWRQTLNQAGGTNLVAEAPDSQVVGFGSCGRPRLGDLAFQGEVYALYVGIDWQGEGLGRRLLCALFAALRGAGVSGAYLWVLAGNPARFFYETMGGTRIAERQESFAGTLLDEIAYGWTDLGAGLTRTGER
jgi:ribosomal protein S18 acetylase RimI-like enzyme